MTDVEALFIEHRGPLFRYLCRAVGHPETARDLTQDIFLRVTRASAAPPAGDARPWLFSIARNLAIDHHRRRRHEGPSALTPAAAEPARQEARASLKEALGALEDLDRDIFLMRELGGLSYDEIAKVCGITSDAVRSRIHRARVRLRERLAGELHRGRRAAPGKTGQRT